MVLDAKLVLDHSTNHPRGPDSRVQAVGHGTAFNNVAEFNALGWRQIRRSSRALPLQKPFLSMRFVIGQPFGCLGSRCLQDIRDTPATMAIGVEQHGVQSLGYTIGAIFLCFATQTHESLIGLGM